MTSSNLSIVKDQALNISRVISNMYYFTQGETITNFSQHALTQLAQVIDISSTYWLVLSDGQPMTVATRYGFGLTEEFLTSVCPLITTEQLKKMQFDSDNCITWQTNTDDNQYAKLHQQYNIHQQMLSLTRHGNTQHLIVLNRESQTNEFTETQKTLLQFVAQCMVNAFHQSLQAKLARHWRYWRSNKAICDQRGHIIEAQADFITTLQDNIPDWDCNKLPAIFCPAKLPSKFEYGAIKIEIVQDDGLYIVEAYHFDHHIESLTPAETRVVQLLLKAKTNKQMAKILSRKEKTIENQMKSVCNKLDVTNRTEAMMILKNSDYRFNDQFIGVDE